MGILKRTADFDGISQQVFVDEMGIWVEWDYCKVVQGKMDE